MKTGGNTLKYHTESNFITFKAIVKQIWLSSLLFVLYQTRLVTHSRLKLTAELKCYLWVVYEKDLEFIRRGWRWWGLRWFNLRRYWNCLAGKPMSKRYLIEKRISWDRWVDGQTNWCTDTTSYANIKNEMGDGINSKRQRQEISEVVPAYVTLKVLGSVAHNGSSTLIDPHVHLQSRVHLDWIRTVLTPMQVTCYFPLARLVRKETSTTGLYRHFSYCYTFLDASSHLFKIVCPLVRMSACYH